MQKRRTKRRRRGERTVPTRPQVSCGRELETRVLISTGSCDLHRLMCASLSAQSSLPSFSFTSHHGTESPSHIKAGSPWSRKAGYIAWLDSHGFSPLPIEYSTISLADFPQSEEQVSGGTSLGIFGAHTHSSWSPCMCLERRPLLQFPHFLSVSIVPPPVVSSYSLSAQKLFLHVPSFLPSLLLLFLLIVFFHTPPLSFLPVYARGWNPDPHTP